MENKIVCPNCNGEKLRNITDLLKKKVRDSTVLYCCEDCNCIFGRFT